MWEENRERLERYSPLHRKPQTSPDLGKLNEKTGHDPGFKDTLVMTKTHLIASLGSDNQDPENNDTSTQRSIWVDIARWRKMQIIKNDLGNWNLYADVAIEQMLASGVLSAEAIAAVKKINQEYGIDFLDDSGWRRTFEIREPWGQTASHIREINEGVTQLNTNLKDLAQAVEDHAMAMLSLELIKPDDAEE